MTRDGDEGVAWLRLSPRMAGAAVVRLLAGAVPGAFAFLLLGQADQVFGLVVVAVLVLLRPTAYLLKYLKFRYRVTDTELQVRTGLLFRSYRRIPLDRIRTVDITAKPVLRLFGLVTVEVGTGQRVSGGDGRISLDAVRAATGHGLRRTLLSRAGRAAEADAAGTDAGSVTGAAVSSPTPTSASTSTSASASDPVLTLRWRWAVFQMFYIWSLLTPLALVGVAYQVLPLVDLSPHGLVARWFTDNQAGLPRAAAVILAVAFFVTLALAGAALGFALQWWGYRLTSDGRGHFRATRGLFTTRSFTVDRSRVRGVTLRDSLTVRALGGTRLAPVLTGVSLGQELSDNGKLLPAVTPDAAQHVANLLLGDEVMTSERPPPGRLEAHPRWAARRVLARYLTCDIAVAATLIVGVWLWSWPPWLLIAPGVLALVHTPAAYGYHRNLGHRLDSGYVFARRGFFVRRTDVVQVRGVCAVTVRQSLFQRRLGLARLELCTAAGERVYSVVDADLARVTALASDVIGEEL
ncbi:MAG TPA: PH domain-containing protein [Streptomyces sp.]|nr:PH domain-containing protein [Streptomyces sp.]